MPNLPYLRDGREFSLGVFPPDPQEIPADKLRSRRLVVFSCVCLPVLMLGLAYTIMRPAEYQATARLEITPASATPPSPVGSTPGAITASETGGQADGGSKSFLTEVQVLTSRPLLEEVVERLSKSGELPPNVGGDPIDGVRRMLNTETAGGTQVVLLRAEGPQRQFLAQLVNTLTAVYQEHLAAAYQKSTGTDADQLRDSVQALDQKVATKRQEVEAFRESNDIVSTERDENQLLSAAKGLAAALNEAKGKLAAAEGQLRAARNAASSGQGVVAAKDNPTVADLERRASQLREELQDLQKRFTPQYMDLDPAAKATRARLDNLEQQIKTERASGQRAAVAEAEGKVTAAREAVEQLQQQINENKRAMQTFMTRFSEFKAMQEDLTHLEQLHRSASDRLARLEASDSEVPPHLEVLEAASVPQLPWRPLYARDAGISLGAGVVLGFLAVWLVEFFSRPEPETTAAERPRWWPVAIGRGAAAASHPRLAADVTRLPAPEPLPRELTDMEIAALLRAANDDGRLILTSLLSGLSAEEIVTLAWDQIDLDAGTIRLGGESPRTLALSDPLRQLITARRALQPPAEGTLLRNASGDPLPLDDVRSLVMYAAYDAGLDDPEEVTSRTLRHTYLVYLLRQGIRFADIGRIVGRLPQEELATYMRFAPSQPRQPLEQIELVMPRLRGMAG